MYGDFGSAWFWYLLACLAGVGVLSVLAGIGWVVWWLIQHLAWIQ